MSDKSLSSLARMLGVLDLFTEEIPIWSAEEIAQVLEVSVPTAYRYVRLLVDAGLLQKSGESGFNLGARIIMLDHTIRMTDPVLNHAMPFMKELVEKTGFDCVITAIYGQQVIDTYREYAKVPADLSYGRGRPRPLFLGGAPKVLLAAMPPAALHKLFDQRLAEVKQAKLPTEWTAFRKYYATIRKRGYYLSHGELEKNLSALAAPIQTQTGHTLGALSLVTTVSKMSLIDHEKLAQWVMQASQAISNRAS